MTIGLQITDGVTMVDCNDGAYIELMELELGYGDVSQQLVAGRFRAYISGTNTASSANHHEPGLCPKTNARQQLRQ